MEQKDIPLVDDFYRDILKTWSTIHFTHPTEAAEMIKQPIWYNTHIKIGEKMVYFDNWAKAGIFHMKCLMDETGNIASKEVLEEKYSFQILGLQYQSLISSIPKEWRKKLTNVANIKDLIISPECKIIINQKETCFRSLPTKDIYWHIMEKNNERPTSEKTWLEISDLNLSENEWKTVYLGPYKIPTDSNKISLHYKISHRILAVGYTMEKWKIQENNKCEMCDKTDTIEHFMIECEKIFPFWQHLFNWFQSITGVRFPVNTYEILFLYPNDDNDVLFNHLNFILLQALYYVYINKKKKIETKLYEFIIICKQRLITEKEIAIANDKLPNFEKRWEMLLNAL